MRIAQDVIYFKKKQGPLSLHFKMKNKNTSKYYGNEVFL